MVPQLSALILGFGIAYGLMPWVMRLAREYEVLDVPNDERRVHLTPVPRLGGVAIFAAGFLAAAVVFGWDYFDSSFELPRRAGSLPGMVIGATIVFITGIVDDLRGV